jgi:hypothetical protein
MKIIGIVYYRTACPALLPSCLPVTKEYTTSGSIFQRAHNGLVRSEYYRAVLQEGDTDN